MATGFELYLAVVFIIVGAILAKLAEEYRFPYPIPLIMLGLLLQALLPQDALGEIPLDFLAQLTLASVLFYAGLTMNIRETRSSIRSVLLLATLGVFLTSIIAGATIALFSPIAVTLAVALLIGAILSPTDPAALFSVLESGGVRVKRKLFSILEGEAVFNDATAVILVITGFLPLASGLGGEQNWLVVLGQFGGSMGLGFALGLSVAYLMARLILVFGGGTNTTILTAATPILAYGIGEIFALPQLGLGLHPGVLAAVFAGIFMANSRRIGLETLPQKSMRSVMKNFSFVFEIVIFTFIGFTLNIGWFFLADNVVFIGVGVLVAILVIFIARPASVFLVTLTDNKMTMKDRFFVSWAGVKGVASAALGAIAVAGIEDADISNSINSIVFIVVLISLVLQGISTPIIARMLNLIEEQDVAQEIASQRDATRHALLHLVDQYTEGKVDSSIYTQLKSELEEEIFTLEDELRRVVSERRARLKMLEMREEIYREKLGYYQREYEQGKIPDPIYEDRKLDLQAEIDEIATVRRQLRSGKESDN
ncbi:MAG: cation:proton antiporter [Candidatus Thorarchaeota archaeon]